MPSKLKRITSSLQRVQSYDRDLSPAGSDKSYCMVNDYKKDDNTELLSYRKRAGSDEKSKTPVNKNYSPILNYMDEEDFKPVHDNVPQPIITRRRRAPITRQSITNGITEEEFKKILRYQELHQLAETESSYMNGETSSGDEEHKAVSSIEKERKNRRSLQTHEMTADFLERFRHKESEKMFRYVPKYYKPNIRIVSSEKQVVRMEIDEVTFKTMMKDLGEVCEQHNYFENSETLVHQGTGSLPFRKKSNMEIGFRKTSTLSRNSSQLWKQPDSPGTLAKLKNLQRRRSDATMIPTKQFEALSEIRAMKSENVKGPWVEIKLRQDEYNIFMSVLTQKPIKDLKSNQSSFRQRHILNFITLRFSYHADAASKYTFSRPSKNMGAILDFEVPVSNKLTDDVSFPIIFPGIPLTFAKIAEHVWTMEHLYMKYLEEDSSSEFSNNFFNYDAKSSEDLSGSYLDISSNPANSAPTTPLKQPLQSEFQRSRGPGLTRQSSEDPAKRGSHKDGEAQRVRKRDRSKNILKNSTRGIQRITERFVDMTKLENGQNGIIPNVPT